MPSLIPGLSRIRKMAIIAGYQTGERYGLLGPQMAATIIEDNSECKCIVIAVTPDDDKAGLKKVLSRYFGSQAAVIGFTSLSGRSDLFELAKKLKDDGGVTLLAGPQAGVDFAGEIGWSHYPHRFKGLAECFSFAIQGPAEQIIPMLNTDRDNDPQATAGLVYRTDAGDIVKNPAAPWDEKFLSRVNWRNLYMLNESKLAPLSIGMGQVLQHIGCPYAALKKEIEIDYPNSIADHQGKSVNLVLRGCSFCDVAADKGFHGRLGIDAVIKQIECLSEGVDGRKISFELINESPLPGLADLLEEIQERGIRIGQINLTLRADWLAEGELDLRRALHLARKMDTAILLGSIGFESFDDTILRNLNKGITTEKNLAAIRLIRNLKEAFPHHLGYSSREGAIHGFIHPTPWDSSATEASIQKNIHLYGLHKDILPPHSTPLIIHHASALGDWIRAIEQNKNIRFKRHGSIIAWWEPPSGS